MAHELQAQICRNGFCHNGTTVALVHSMELDEIKRRMAERGYQQADLANLLNIDPSAVSKRLTGKRSFKLDEMRKIEPWLGGGSATLIDGVGVTAIPIIGQVAAGNWKEAIQQPEGMMPVPYGAPRNAVALRVVGDSMDLEIEEGGLVIVDVDDKALFPKRLYVVLNDEGETTFKQFESEPARLEPRSTNPAHRPILIGDGQGFTIVGRVTALYRQR